MKAKGKRSNSVSDPLSTVLEPLKAAVIHPWHPHPKGVDLLRPIEAALEEAVNLTAAINLDVVYFETVRLNHPTPATLLGAGAVERLKAQFSELGVSLAVINHPLSPVQQRNLERDWQIKVIDRTGLILEIFGDRARTAEGKLQVELAALDFQRSRLVRSWTHLERQRGGHGFLGGPGESQLEIDRRLIDDRIIRIKKDLEKVRQTRSLQRNARVRNETPTIALVGYTNAGKSSLFNALTTSEVFAKDMLFATLDPTMRQLVLPSNRQVILSDTVGFISDLPHQLVESFKATLEEVEYADIILHVRDAASADSEAQNQDVIETLTSIGLDPLADPRVIEVFNKIDLLDEGEQQRLLTLARRSKTNSVGVSALTGAGLADLCALIENKLAKDHHIIDIALSASNGAELAWLHRHGRILQQETSEDGAEIFLQVALSTADMGRYAKRG